MCDSELQPTPGNDASILFGTLPRRRLRSRRLPAQLESVRMRLAARRGV
ncbi:hypothetical protein SAMN05444172_4752 [Burkholderia sp. GAS332]|nr:hypothetical protein SAMN05444172_4752 [Burkholderia sp. GAS332]